MTLYELWNTSQQMELGFNPLGPIGIEEMLKGEIPFSKLEDSIRELKQNPIGQSRGGEDGLQRAD